jgi:hypothetical protein
VARFEGAAGHGISIDELKQVFSHKGFQNYDLIQGNIVQTVPDYLNNHPELKIALLHIDVDVYKPSAVILDHFFYKTETGGRIQPLNL